MDNINNNTSDTTNTKEYRDLREEWSSGVIRLMASRSLGEVCYNCGSSESVELHHIVPLKLGGTNNLSNIAVLCHKCHMSSHYGRHIRDYQNKKIGGRPHKVSSIELNQALDDYLNCRIGTKECKGRIKMAKTCKISDMTFYKNLLKELGIKSFRNNIDIIANKRGEIKKGDKAGYIVYINGDVKNVYYGE